MAGVNISSGFQGIGMSSMSSSSVMQSSVTPVSPVSTATPISISPTPPPEK
jgi:hypothetical protein